MAHADGSTRRRAWWWRGGSRIIHSALLSGAGEELRDSLRGQLAIGLHRNVQVTDVAGEPRRYVSQAFCSALPASYSHNPNHAGWAPFARLAEWIDDGIERALSVVEHAGLDIRLVDYGRVAPSSQVIADRWG